MYGYAQDTTYMTPRFLNRLDSVRVDKKIAIVDSGEIANIDLAGPNYVTYVDGVACDYNKRLIAISHSHPGSTAYSLPTKCDHSDLDAIFTHIKEQKYWFSLVFCPYANSLLWADGRRLIFEFGQAENNSNSNGGGVDNSFSDHYIRMMERIKNFN